jgi:adenylyl cyclase-associated protein
VNSFYTLMKGLIGYVKAHYHPKGVKWNPEGVSVTDALQQIRSAPSAPPPAAATSRGPPAPPPPPPPSQLLAAAAQSAPAKPKGGDMGAIFQELNQGEGITSGLKKVDPSQQTHKNPSLRGSAPEPQRSDSQTSTKSIPPHTKPKPESMRTKKPPRKELDGTKWIIVRISQQRIIRLMLYLTLFALCYRKTLNHLLAQL